MDGYAAKYFFGYFISGGGMPGDGSEKEGAKGGGKGAVQEEEAQRVGPRPRSCFSAAVARCSFFLLFFFFVSFLSFVRFVGPRGSGNAIGVAWGAQTQLRGRSGRSGIAGGRAKKTWARKRRRIIRGAAKAECREGKSKDFSTAKGLQ